MGAGSGARRRRRTPALVAILPMALAMALGVLALASVAPVSANVTVNEIYTIPTSGAAAGRFTIVGRGYGHGHGLSQYGAKGAAEKGLNAAQILAFYYPSTSKEMASGNLRVLLTDAPRDSLQVLPTSRLAVVDTGDHNAAYALPTTIGGVAVKQWRLGLNGRGKAVVSYLQASWTSYRTLVGDGEFVDRSLGYVTLLNPSTKRYRGSLLAASAFSGDLHRSTVNVVGLEQYVDGVVPSEMSPSWPGAALQAQAIAARTYALFEKYANAGRYYDICDSTWCQVYGGMAANRSASTAAVAATRGEFLSYQGKPAFTQFSASNGGWESYGGQPYLPSKADPYTPTAEQTHGRSYSWSYADVSIAALQNAYPSIGTPRTIAVTSREGGAGDVWGGRVMALKITGTDGSATVYAGAFAAIYGLPSTWFKINGSTGSSSDTCGPASSSGSAPPGQQPGIGVGEATGCVQQIYLVNASRHLMTKWQTSPGGSWTRWQDWGGSYAPGSPVGVGHAPNGAQQIYLIDASGHLMTRWQTGPGASWSGWQDWGGGYTPATPIGVGHANGAQQIYLVGASGHLLTMWQRAAGAGWTAMQDWGGSYPSGAPVGVGAGANGAQQIYLIDRSGHLITMWQAAQGGAWTRMQDWGGSYGPATPIGVGRSAGSQQIYLVDRSGHLITMWQTAPGSGWTVMQDWGGSYPSGAPIGVGSGANGAQQIYLVSADGSLLTQWQTAPGGGWSSVLNWGTSYNN